ncbi:MAG: hypothetical protein AABZ30_02805 [Myxococcota bacterium]
MAVLLVASCADFGGEPDTAVAGRLTVGPGVVFLERGSVQQGVFERAGRIREDGRFVVELPAPGTWGVHTYVADYIYLPLEIEVGSGFVTPVEQPAIAWQVFRAGRTWSVDGRQPADISLLEPPPDADPSDDPVISNPRIEFTPPDVIRLSLDVTDPDGNLSRQVLAYFTGMGDGIAMNAPASPINDNYPDGTYTATYLVPEGVDPTAPWVFVAADHFCSVSEILEAEAEEP